MNKYLVSDLLDVPVSRCPPQVGLEHAAVKHALVLNKAWKESFGVPMSKYEAIEYTGGDIVAHAHVDRQAFINYVAGVRKLPQKSCPNMRAYERELDDPAFLREEIVRKLNERHGGTAPINADPEEAFLSIVGPNPQEYYRASAAAVDLRVNPVTQHFVGPPTWDVEECGRLDRLRSVIARDFLFVTQASTSVCVFVETVASDSVRPCVIDGVLGEAAANTQFPITIMSDDIAFLKEKRDFFYYANHVDGDGDAYACIPHVFGGFMLVGCARLPKRLPLTRNASKTFYYSVNADLDLEHDHDGGEKKLDPAVAAQSYVMVCDTVVDCSETQKLTRNIVYIAPQFVTETFEHAHEFACHPDSAHHAPRAPAVEPDDAGTCRIYVNLENSDGVLECMASGGVPVVSRAYDGLFHGFNCLVSDAARFADEIAKSDIERIGRTARESLLVHNEAVFRWIWRGIMTNPCPIKANSPRHGAMLHTRFLVMYTIAFLRRALEYEVDPGPDPDRTLLIVDNREDVGTVLSALVSLTNLEPGWGVTVFATKANEKFMSRNLPRNSAVKVIDNYPSKSFFIEAYNRLMKTEAFWRSVPGSRCLLIQNDGTLVRPGLERHACFAYALVGAPWAPHPYLDKATGGNLVGNGGLTLRDPRECARACRENKHERLAVYEMCPIMSEAEDVFFARRIANACPNATAREFAMEQIASPKALGFHRFWAYHPVPFTVETFETALADAFKRL